MACVLNKPEFILPNATGLSKRMFHMSMTTNTINNILFQQKAKEKKTLPTYMTIKQI